MRSTVPFLLVLLAGCARPVEPQRQQEVLGYIQGFHRDDPRIEVPDVVSRGQAFSVVVTTYGDGCTSMGRTEVAPSAGGAVVTPIDLEDTSANVCADVLRTFRHEASVQLDRAGTARIVVRGRDSRSGREVQAERTVTVR